MSSPMSSKSVPSQNYSHHLSVYPSYSMHKNYAVQQIDDSAAHKSLMTEQLPFYHQAPPVQYTQLPAAQPQQIEWGRVEEEVLVVQLQRPLFGLGKPRLHWTQELHERFVRAVFELGGSFSATPKAILKKMNVKGLTLDQIKSHLQKSRTRDASKLMHQGIQNNANSHSPQLSGQGFSTSRSTAHVNGKGLESFQADIVEYGKLLQSSETPTYYQNLMFAPMGDYQDNAHGSNFGL